MSNGDYASCWLTRLSRDDDYEPTLVMSYRGFVKRIRERMKERGCRHMSARMLHYAYKEWDHLCRTKNGVDLFRFFDEIIDDQCSASVSIV